MTVKTEKQVVSGGFHRPVCTRCCCELHPETNGVGVLDTTENGPYELYDADLWKCPKCRLEVVGGFAHGPISTHYDPDFQKHIDFYQKRGLLINNKG